MPPLGGHAEKSGEFSKQSNMSRQKRLNATAITSICAWCGKRIPKDAEVFSLGAKARAGVDLASYEGKAFQLTLTQPPKTLVAIVPTHDSQAKKEGNDLLFAICSQRCGQALKQALQRQIDMIDRIVN